MTEFEEIESLKNSSEKTKKMKNFYKEKVKIDNWMNNDSKVQIINFKDRTEYKKNGVYHRINGPAIDYTYKKDEDKYYYKGELYSNKDKWSKIVIKEVRKVKLKKLNNTNENEKSSE